MPKQRRQGHTFEWPGPSSLDREVYDSRSGEMVLLLDTLQQNGYVERRLHELQPDEIIDASRLLARLRTRGVSSEQIGRIPPAMLAEHFAWR